MSMLHLENATQNPKHMRFRSIFRSSILLIAVLLFVISPVLSKSLPGSGHSRNSFFTRKLKHKSSNMEMTREAIICPTAPPAIGPYSHV